MEFRGWRKLAGVSQLGQGLQLLESLQHLVMYFRGCGHLADAGPGPPKVATLAASRDGLPWMRSSCGCEPGGPWLPEA